MKIITSILFLLLFWSLPLCSIAQVSLELEIADYKSVPITIQKNKSYPSQYHLELALKQIIKNAQREGYLSSSIDSITGDSINKMAYLFLGPKFKWVTLNTDSVDEDILTRTGFRDKQFSNKPFNPKQISSFFNDALHLLENNGYPFAQIKLDDVTIRENDIRASVILNKNKLYKVDSIQILGEDTRLNKHYIQNVIHIKPGNIYNEKVIKQISSRINENPFMSEAKPYEVLFTEESCKIILILQPEKANVFDGIIGLQPQPNNDGVILTGDIKLSVGNIVGQGERIDLRWQRLKNETQEIKTALSIPFLFKTPIGFGYKLDIYRQDTSFNNVNHLFNIPFRMNNGSSFKGFFKNYSTRLIATSPYENSTAIPIYNDAKIRMYGVGYSGSFVENIYNPYQGWLININGGAGTNEIIKNVNLENVNYDSVNLQSSIMEASLNLSFFQPIGKTSTILLRVNTATKQSENLSSNQLYRIGGLNTIRGFDEQSIFASSFAISTIEYRFLFDSHSRISVFYDIGWYEEGSITEYKTDIPFGFGAGITFGTNAGMFTLNYGLGSQLGNPINFKTGKIHFGFVNLF